MTTIYFSPSTKGFYPAEFKEEYVGAGTWPADAFVLTNEQRDELWMKSTPLGKTLDQRNGELKYYDLPPVYKTRWSSREYRAKFTLEEQVAIRAASLVDMEVGLVYDEFLSAQYIDINDPTVAEGLTRYVAKGLLTEERKAELLKPEIQKAQS